MTLDKPSKEGSTGRTKANEGKPKSCLGQVFHFKLGSFALLAELHGADARPYIKLKTRPRFCPASLSLYVCSVTFHPIAYSARDLKTAE